MIATKIEKQGDYVYISTNLRCIIEHCLLDCLQYICEPTQFHARRYTFDVITDIGVTREMNRHRTFSVAEMSTRYCDLTKDKFGSELTFIRPAWESNQNFDNACDVAESMYRVLRADGWKPEQARQVLPLGLKTEAVYTAYKEDWQHFLKLRADNVSGKAHPNIQIIANQIKQLAKENHLW